MNLDFPLHFDTAGATAQVGDDAHVRDMIEMLLFTNPGERVNRPEFGSGLMQLVFAPNSPELAGALEFAIQAGLQQWLGDIIAVQGLTVVADEATLRIDLAYTVLRTGEEHETTLERAVGA